MSWVVDLSDHADTIRLCLNAEVLDVPPSEFQARAVAALDALVAENERLRDALEDAKRWLEGAQGHIKADLQPAFVEIAETGKLPGPKDWSEAEKAWRLATWWHGCGDEDALAKMRAALDGTP